MNDPSFYIVSAVDEKSWSTMRHPRRFTGAGKWRVFYVDPHYLNHRIPVGVGAYRGWGQVTYLIERHFQRSLR